MGKEFSPDSSWYLLDWILAHWHNIWCLFYHDQRWTWKLQQWSITTWVLGKWFHVSLSYPYRSIISNILLSVTIAVVSNDSEAKLLGRVAAWRDRMIYCFAHLSNVINYLFLNALNYTMSHSLFAAFITSCIALLASHPYQKILRTHIRNEKNARAAHNGWCSAKKKSL